MTRPPVFRRRRRVIAGYTYHLAKPGHDTAHLWIVVTDEDSTGEVAIVSLTSYRPWSTAHSNSPVLLRRGDHPAVRHDSIVFYQDIRKVPAEALEKAIEGGAGRRHADCSDEILERIQQGVFQSPHTPPEIAQYVRTRLDND